MAFVINALSYIGLLDRARPLEIAAAAEPAATRTAGRRHRRPASATSRMSPHIRNVLLRSFLFGIGASSLLRAAAHRGEGADGRRATDLRRHARARFGIGAVAGALASARVRLRLDTEGQSCVPSTIALAAAICVVAASNLLVISLLDSVIAGAAWVLALSTFNVAVQMSAPRWVVGRALSSYQMSTFAGIALGSWLWGLVTPHRGCTFRAVDRRHCVVPLSAAWFLARARRDRRASISNLCGAGRSPIPECR
jgi:hypothetical protein